MAEIPAAVWMKASMEAAMKLLDARSRQALAEADVTAAEQEMERLTGNANSIDLNRSSYTHHFECEGTLLRAVLEDERQERGETPTPPGKCANVVEIWGTDLNSKPKLCPDCLALLPKPKPAEKEAPKPVSASTSSEEIPF